MSKRSTNFNPGRKSARLSASNLLGLMDALGISPEEQKAIALRASNTPCSECSAPATTTVYYGGAARALPLCSLCAEAKHRQAENDEPARTNDAEDRANRGGW